MAKKKRRTCILVLGMHRSGTSALARVLNLLGAALPKNLMPAVRGNNDAGFWEPLNIAIMNDNMLAEAGSSWDDWRKIDLDAQLPESRLNHYKAEIRRLITEEYGDAPLFVLKEPRICRFVPLYREVLEGMGIVVRPVLIFRNPLAVSASLMVRDNLDEGQSYLYWLRHVLDAEAATRDLPRATATYEALIGNWRAAVDLLVAQIDIDWPRRSAEAEAEITAFLRRDLDHHPVKTSDLAAMPDIAEWIRRAYTAVEQLGVSERNAITELDVVAATFEPAAAVFGKALEAERAACARAYAAGDAARTVASAREAAQSAEIEKAQAEQEKLQAKIVALKEGLATAKAGVAEQAALERQLKKARARIDKAKTEITELAERHSAEIAELQEALDRQREETHVHLGEARAAAVADGRARNAANTVEQNNLRTEIGNLQDNLAAAEIGAAVRLAELEVARQDLASMASELERTHASYRNSTSWKLTAPMRAVKVLAISIIRPFVRSIRLVSIVPAAIRHGGGLVSTVKKALRILRGEGIDGISRRIEYAGLYQRDNTSKIDNKILNYSSNDRMSFPASSQSTINNSNENRKNRLYVDQILSISENKNEVSTDFVPKSDTAFNLSDCPIKTIAFYLPQFHPIPENDKWWGKGFTEWTNVSKATPQFVGHYQPHLPGELGFYDLRVVEVQRQQAELAKHYGISGFCYHHYWFGGKRLLERPFDQILANPDIDLPFCLCWANENWTRRWDGMEQDVLIAQNHSPEDDLAFIADIAPALRDPRYIRFKGKPVLLVYRVTLLPDARATAGRWRDYCRREGIGELYLVAARSFGIRDPRPYGFDAAVEFPPHEANAAGLNEQIDFINPDFEGNVFSFDDMVDSHLAISSEEFANIKTVCPGWDNEARKPGKGHNFLGASPNAYSRWLRGACEHTLRSMSADPNQPPFVFINAWNEWAEGAHLEPDRKFGYANLHVTANVLQGITPRAADVEAAIKDSQSNFIRRAEGAVVLHLYYGDLLDELLPYIENAKDMDLLVSVGPNVTMEQIMRLRNAFPNCYLAAYPNKGRDILPFIEIVKVLQEHKYIYACKIHSKKSLQRKDGSRLRADALENLLGSPERVRKLSSMFETDSGLGLAASSRWFLDLKEPDRNILNRSWLDKLLGKLGRRELVGAYSWQFVAGTMFWFRIDAMSWLDSIDISAGDFEDELGQVDGTLGHAVERIISLGVCEAGYSVSMLKDEDFE